MTLGKYGISVNAVCISWLGNPDRVEMGYDEVKHAIAIRPYSGNLDVPSFEFAKRAKEGWIRIGCKDFMRFLSSSTNIDFVTKSKQFIPSYNKEANTLVITVSEENIKK